MKCPSCNWFYFETDKTCQHCNAPLPKPTKPKVSLEKVFSKSNTATVSKKSQAKVVGKSHIAVVVDNGNRPSEKSTDNVSNAPAKSVMTDIPNYNHLTDSCQSVHSVLTHELWLDSEDTH